LEDFLIYLLIGLGIGIMSGFFGIGGGFILTPILILMQFSPVVAVATSLLYTIGTSLSGTLAHFKLNNIQWKTSIIIGSSGIIATQVAHPFVLLLEKKNLEETSIPVLYILLIIYFSFTMLKQRPDPFLTTNDTPSHYYQKIIFIGFFAGFISTTLGVGGGFIIVPLLISMLYLKPKFAVGTSLVSVLMIVIIGFASYSFSTPIDYKISGSLILGALVGGQLGALATRGYRDAQVRYFLAGLYITTGISLVLKLIHFDIAGLIILIIYCLILLSHFGIHFIRGKHLLKQKQIP